MGLPRPQGVHGDEAVAAAEGLPGGVGKGEVPFDEVQDRDVGVPAHGQGADLVGQAKDAGRPGLIVSGCRPSWACLLATS
jgi:hypothetical protein